MNQVQPSASVVLRPNKGYPNPGDRISMLVTAQYNPFIAVLAIIEGPEPRTVMSRYAVTETGVGQYKLTKRKEDGGEVYYVDLRDIHPRCTCTGSAGYYCKHMNAMAEHKTAGHLNPPPESVKPSEPEPQTCGFCGGHGRVQTPTHDRYGYENFGPQWTTCEYCGGTGLTIDGDKLLPAKRYR